MRARQGEAMNKGLIQPRPAGLADTLFDSGLPWYSIDRKDGQIRLSLRLHPDEPNSAHRIGKRRDNLGNLGHLLLVFHADPFGPLMAERLNLLKIYILERRTKPASFPLSDTIGVAIAEPSAIRRSSNSS